MGNQVAEMLENRMKVEAEQLHERFKPQMQAFEKSILAKVRGSAGLQHSDYYALGKQLEQYENYQKICEEEGKYALAA